MLHAQHPLTPLVCQVKERFHSVQACCHCREGEELLQARDAYGRTPLHYCLLYEAYYIARMLLRRGADKNVKDCAGQTALDIAIRRGRMQDEELLVLLSQS